MTLDEEAYLNQAQNFQAIFEKAYDIPTAGRSPYQRWQASQWEMPASEYSLQSSGLESRPYAANVAAANVEPVTAESMLRPWLRSAETAPVSDLETTFNPNTTFSDFLNRRIDKGQPISRFARTGYLKSLAGRGSTGQRELLETLPEYVRSNTLFSRLQRKFPRFVARGMAVQDLMPEARRRFDIDPEATRAGQTFLDFIRDKYWYLQGDEPRGRTLL
jgi:hypothetical protein